MFGRKIDVVSKHVTAEKFFGKGRTVFMRFLPESNLDDTIDDAKKDLEDDAKKEQVDVDKERQRADQEAANAVKARQRAEQSEAANIATKTELANLEVERQKLEQELAAATAKATENQMPTLDVSEMEGTEKVLAQSIVSLQEQIKVNAEITKKASDAQQAEIDQYKANEAAKVSQTKSDAGYNAILAKFDGDFGAECRNEAVAAYQEKWANGEIEKDNGAMATLALQDCYKEAAEKVKAQKKTDNKGFIPDTGSGGGGSGGNITTLNTKQGDRSLAEVVAEAKGAMT